MDKKCTCPSGTRWIEQPPTSTARYRVECITCRTFIKWGSLAQRNALIDAGEDGEVVPYEESLGPPAPTLDAFIVPNDEALS